MERFTAKIKGKENSFINVWQPLKSLSMSELSDLIQRGSGTIKSFIFKFKQKDNTQLDETVPPPPHYQFTSPTIVSETLLQLTL